MSKNKLFQDLDLNHKPNRNGYDLSHNFGFSAKAGELLPVFHRTVMPGDVFDINLSMFTRTSATLKSPRTKVREYVDVFFVPYRILWKNSRQVHTNNKKNPDVAITPYSNRPVGDYTPRFDFWKYMRSSGGNAQYTSDSGYLQRLCNAWNSFGLNRGILSAKLMSHLGYGYWSRDIIQKYVDFDVILDYETPFITEQYLSIYPLLAYQCIYYKFFRNSQWEDNVPYNYNVDYLGSDGLFDVDVTTNPNGYWNNPTVFDLQYSNYPRDLFFGVFPDAQYGDEAVVNGESESNSSFSPLITKQTGTINSEEVVVGSNPELIGNPLSPHYYIQRKDWETAGEGSTLVSNAPLGVELGKAQASFGILELRKAQFEQRYKEIIGSGQNEYKTLIRKIFGIEVPDTLADMPTYLGGHMQEIKWDTTTNTNLVDGASATLSANGVGSSNGGDIHFEAKEHGIIMAIYHCQPVVTYQLNALHFDVTKTEFDDYANPVFDQLGFAELPVHYLDITRRGNAVENILASPIGYTNRYYDYKTSVDNLLGFQREFEPNWFAPVDFNYLSKFLNSQGDYVINANFFRVNPHILNPIFVVQASNWVSTDQFYPEIHWGIKAVRPLDYHGVPY